MNNACCWLIVPTLFVAAACDRSGSPAPQTIQGQTDVTAVRSETATNLAKGPTHNSGAANEGLSPAFLLAKGATTTYDAWLRAGQSEAEPLSRRSNDIPALYWSEEIQRLQPTRVYTHRMNLVVAQNVTNGWEEGVYLHTVWSSYLPMQNDDGFEFKGIVRSGDSVTIPEGALPYRRRLER